ncbi:gamma-glutamyltranspeptidase [Histoplasma capsulatum var. duboisii H88]|uniref:Glutathione hydrolase n=1 Tax=Ajellomyces capsulatus (strain H88) TaxID=544711 RepID=F0UT94_AJEC8|nr:gamma-glutamyltranspeptidase [Histoplasma capsulatum var. duboisii H88]
MFSHSLVVVVSAASMMLLIAVSLYSSLTTFWGRLDVQLSSDASAPRNGRHGQLGAVASENRNCSQMGAEMLKMGGTAADADMNSFDLPQMVATVFCIGVIAMYHSGISGGGFAIVRTPEGEYEVVDFREMAPAAAHKDMYKGNVEGAVLGGLASAVPGEIRGLQYLHEKYGTLPWSTVMQPAIHLAREGWPINVDLVNYMETATAGKEDFLSKDPSWAVDFAPNGTRLGLGDTITRARYSQTLETIANYGPDAFYSGPLADSMIRALQAHNGTMTLDDLKNYSVVIRNASHINYRGYTVTSTRAPSSGVVALSILNIVGQYDDFFVKGNVNLSTHHLVEAMRFAYGQRTHLADPSYSEGMDEYEDHMLNSSMAAILRNKISDSHTLNVSDYNPNGFESLETPGTSHIVAADSRGLTISLTTTINLLFGSKVMVPETGIIMNNDMDDFSIPGTNNSFGYIPSPANFIEPGKRMLSSICPVIVTHPNGTVYFITGAAGGSRIITGTVQSVINLLDRNMTTYDALKEPRVHDQLSPNVSEFEYSFDNSTVAFMISRNHSVKWVLPGASKVQAIRLMADGMYEAVGEPRQVDSGGAVA